MKLNITPQEIINLFESPRLALDLDDDKWQDILRVLRFNDMTATLANILSVNNIALRSHFALKHLDSSSIYAQRQALQVRNESYSLKKLLSNAEMNPIFLKGAAYILASDENSHGRLMSDIDVLVDKKRLHEVESILKSNGWREKRLDNYDEQYYRKWSHELPPFRHITSGTTLDVHHTLIPPITGKSIPIESVLAESARVDGVSQTLSLEWRLLHCIIHFFFNEDYEKPFRDLWDLKCLFCSLHDKEHLEKFLSFATALGFRTEAIYAVRLVELNFCSFKEKFGTNLDSNDTKLSKIESIFFNLIVVNMAIPRHPKLDSFLTKFSSFVMMIRGHFKKMPLKILIPHISVKVYRGVIKTVYGRYHFE